MQLTNSIKLVYRSLILSGIIFTIPHVVLAEESKTSGTLKSQEVKIEPEDSRKITIPAGVRYKYATPEVNAQSRDLMRRLWGTEAERKAARAEINLPMTVGPGLWHGLKDKETLNGPKVVFKIPNQDANGKQTGKQSAPGGLIQENNSEKFWNLLDATWNGPRGKVRKLEPQELDILWRVIPFDLEEPVWLVEVGDQRVVLIYVPETKAVCFIENVAQMYVIPPAKK